MAGTNNAARYSHTQKAPLCLILYGAAIVALMVAIMSGEWQGMVVVGVVVSILIVLAAAFHHLTVEDEGDLLAIRFGPVPLFQKRLRYADIREVEVGRTLVLDGWGIHYSLRGGWVWNLWGRDCVVLHLKGKGILRIGTDDAEGLAAYLRGRIGA